MDTTLKEIMFDKRIFIDKIILKNTIKNTFENINGTISRKK